MKDALGLLLTIIACLSGVATFVYFSTIKQSKNDALLNAYPAPLLAYTCLILSWTVLRYIFNTGLIQLSIEMQVFVLSLLTIALSSWMGRETINFFSILSVNKLSTRHFMFMTNRLPFASLISMILMTTFLIIDLDEPWGTPTMIVAVLIGMMPLLISTSVSLHLLIKSITVGKLKEKRIGFGFIGFAGLQVSLVLAELIFIEPSQLPGSGLALPLSYMLWNIISIIYVSKRINERAIKFRTENETLAGVPVNPVLMQEFGLSPREQQITLLIARGLANKEIAAELGISSNTTRNYLAAIFHKTGAKSRVDLLTRFQSQ